MSSQEPAKDFFLPDRHVRRDIGKDRGAHEVTPVQPVRAAKATRDQRGVFVNAALDQVLDLVELHFRHNRADLAAFDVRWSDLCFLGHVRAVSTAWS